MRHIALLALLGLSMVGCYGGSAAGGTRAPTDTPELHGAWRGSGWGLVNLWDGGGSYTDTYGREPGWLRFERVAERTYEGSWGEGTGKRRYGHLRFTLSPDGDHITGTWGAAPDSEIRPGSPAEDTLTWVRQGSVP